MQKEGCDGLITSARFILHKMPPAIRTVVPRVLRAGARFHAGHRRDQGLPRRAAEDRRRAGDARGPRASRREVREGGRLRDQGQAPRPAEDGAAGRHRRRRRRRRREGRVRGRAHRQPSRRRRLRRGVGRGAQEVLARPRAHRGHRPPHQRVQDQRGRGDPVAATRRLYRRHRAHQHRAVAQEQASPGRRARAVPDEPAPRARLAAGERRQAAAGDRRRQGRGGAHAGCDHAASVAGLLRSPRRDVPGAAEPRDRGVVEEASCANRSPRSSTGSPSRR